MDCIQAKLGSGELEGVRISNNLTICHRLFADNFSIFIPAIGDSFNKLQVVIQLYKKASGAKLNLNKSVIVLLALPTIPLWLINTGFSINPLGVIQKNT